MKQNIITFLVMMLVISFGLSVTGSHIQEKEGRIPTINKMIPDSFDWRDVEGHDWTTPVRDQIQDECGSCWGFGALGSLEAMVKIWSDAPDEPVDLSEQYLLSCSPGGCNGWYLSMCLNWIKRNGMITEDCFPYEADDTIPCEAKCEDWHDVYFGITGYHRVNRTTEDIQQALVEHGPLSASMIVYEDFYPDFDGGVYQYSYGEVVFGHCIAIVGYDNTWGDEDEGYWICKNSWGTEWGEDGWFRIAYGECDIEKGVYYLTGPNYPPDKPQAPIGTETGELGTPYEFTATAIDGEGDKVYIAFDWGDGDVSRWLGPVSSGESISENHTWITKGTYEVRVHAKDSYGLVSEWSDPSIISMPKTKEIRRPLRSLVYLHPLIQELMEMKLFHSKC
jgi:hypothetical protein